MKRKSIIAVTIVCLIFISSLSVFGQSNIKTDFVSAVQSKPFGSYKYLGKRYDLYMTTQNNGKIIWTGTLLTVPIYHSQGVNGGKTSAGQYSSGISWNSTYSWNSTVGVSVPASGIITTSAQEGRGSSKGWAATKMFSISQSFDEGSLTPTSKSGYYAIAAGMPHYKIKWLEFNNRTNAFTNRSSFFYMPYGHVTAYTVYSSNQENWIMFR